MTWVPTSDVASALSSWWMKAINPKGKKIWRLVPTTVYWSVWLERNNKVLIAMLSLSFKVYRKDKNLLLLWGKRVRDCDNDQKGGLMRDWESVIDLV